MKAYEAWNIENCDRGNTVVFAENSRQAKKIAFSSEICEDAEWTSVRVRRLPEMDKHYRGFPEVNWDNAQDRRALVNLGWTCLEPLDSECKNCPAGDLCRGPLEEL